MMLSYYAEYAEQKRLRNHFLLIFTFPSVEWPVPKQIYALTLPMLGF